MYHQLKGHMAALIANVIFGLGIPIAKSLLTQWVTPIGFLAFRTITAVIVFWIIQCFMPKEHVTKKDMYLIVGGGIMGFVVAQYFTGLALKYASPVNYALLAALSPVFVMVMAAFYFKEKISSFKVIGVLLGIMGAAIIVVKGGVQASGSNEFIGIMFSLASVLTYCVYVIIMRRISTKYSAITQMKWMFFYISFIILPLGVYYTPKQRLLSSACEWSGILSMSYIAVAATVIGFFLMPVSLKYLKATTVSIYHNLQPVIASIIAIFIGQDVFTWDKPIAGAMVILGAYIVTGIEKDK